MRYLPIDNQLFVENRKKLSKILKPGSLAVFHSNDIMPTSADGTMPFRQQSDLFYLSGIDQEETVLVMFPDHPDENLREILFVKETSDQIAIWEGHKYTMSEATEISGIKSVKWSSDFYSVLDSLVALADYIYLNTNEHLRASKVVETRNDRFVKWCISKYPIHRYERLGPVMHQLRAVKSEPEIELLRKACEITEKGFRRILKFIKPGVMEYEIEAELIHEFVRNRSRGFAYAPIIASGFNACVLHYIENNEKCKDGDLLLLDIGAEYANYNGDLTRSIPVNGRYTKRQREVYEAVLRVQRAAMDLLVPGNSIPEYHKEVGKIMEAELIGLGLLDKKDLKNQNPGKPLYKKYFMHGTSHHLGLDVHDYGNMYRKFESGMVFTVEPGIYIREESLGVRIENDVVIRENTVEDLMKSIPIEAGEIEEIMNEGG